MTEQEAKYENMEYMGKALTKKGKTKDGSKEWKLFKLEFKGEGQYNRKISCFESLPEKSLQLKDLEEGETYNIGYKEKPDKFIAINDKFTMIQVLNAGIGQPIKSQSWMKSVETKKPKVKTSQLELSEEVKEESII